MTTTRKPFNALTKKVVLLDANNKPITCTYPGCKCQATNIHHNRMVCEGGSNDVSNLKPYCKKHHIQLHSTQGHFVEWGKKGGKASAKTGQWRKNLKQYQNKVEVAA